jgi:hypothetical protein
MSSDEAWRHECEARHVFALRLADRNRALAYLELVEKRRGAEAAQNLKQAAAALWADTKLKGRTE